MNRRTGSALWIAVLLTVPLSAACCGADVVINEVAWSGTAANASDEWIELHNLTEAVVDLTGWTLAFGETVIHLGTVEDDTLEVRRATIEPDGYVVLERTDDKTIPDVEGDILYKGNLSNGGVGLELRNAFGEVVDRVNLTEEGWPAGMVFGEELLYGSMERVDPLYDAEAWATNDGRIRNGTDAEGHPLNGTPGQENSAHVRALAAPRVELIAPIEEAMVLSGTVIIEWCATDPDGTPEGLRVAIEISTDGGETWEALAANLANGGSYAWDTTQHADGDRVYLKVVVEDEPGYRSEAESPILTIRNEAK